MTDKKGVSDHSGNTWRRRACDKDHDFCRGNNIPTVLARLTVPPAYRRSLNHCNLSAEALGSLAFQLAPQPLEVDGVQPLHRPLFGLLDEEHDPDERARLFQAYMAGHFLLTDSAARGLTDTARIDRSRLDYLRLLRGWLFDAEGREAAVLKGWVESRFGLLTLFHRQRIGTAESDSRAAFEHELAVGLYSTGALEAQLDLLYAWCQYELSRRHPGEQHLLLYRGLSRGTESLGALPNSTDAVLLNNLSSFSAERERADEFGDRVFACQVPLAKILAFSRLLPGRLQGEEEYLVIGGVVAVKQLA